MLPIWMPGATVEFEFTLSDKDGGRVASSATFEAADLVLYKRGSGTPRSSAAGVTAPVELDSKTGLYRATIDLADNTDAGFYANGTVIKVLLYPDETVDTELVTAIVYEFVIGGEVSPDRPVIGVAQGGAVGYVDLPASASSVDGAYKGAMATVRHASGAIESRVQSAIAYVGETRRLSVDPNFDTAPSSTSTVWLTILPPAPVTNVPVVAVSATSLTAILNALLNWELISGYSLAKLFRTIGAIFNGAKTGGNTATESYTWGGITVDAEGLDADTNRSGVTSDASGTP